MHRSVTEIYTHVHIPVSTCCIVGYETGSLSLWRHQMGTLSALLAICAGNSSVPVNSPHKGQWHGALMFSLICVWINGWINNRKAGDLRRHRAHCDVIVMVGFVQQVYKSIFYQQWRRISVMAWQNIGNQILCFVQQFVQAINKNIKAPHYYPFVRGIHQSP